VSVVQIRESDLNAREYVRFIRECVTLAGTTCRVIVNDRLDLALAGGAHGVHLRENSIAISEARQLAPPDLLVGRSIHDARTAAAAQTADYLIAGSVFETASKPGQQPSLGLSGLRAVVLAAGTCPVWAVGGITEESVTDVKAAGVEGIAAIGAFFPSPASTDVAGEVRRKTEALRFSLERFG
jgi:thiamine-phosphate diphosphorylase